MTNQDFTRWYDRNPRIKKIINALRDMPESARNELAGYLLKAVRAVWKERRSESEEVSIGVEKLMSYYKAYNKRRWYDQCPQLSSAINLMSTLPDQDLNYIAEGFITALKVAGKNNLYQNNINKEKNNDL